MTAFDDWAKRSIAARLRGSNPEDYNLTLPEELRAGMRLPPRRALSDAMAPEPLDGLTRWMAGPIGAAIDSAKRAPGHAFIHVLSQRGAGAELLLRQLLPDAPIVDFGRRSVRAEAEGAPLSFLERYAGAPALLLLQTHLAPRTAAAAASLAGAAEPAIVAQGGTLSGASRAQRAPKLIAASALAKVAEIEPALETPGVSRFRLRTLTEGEIAGSKPDFIERLAALDFPTAADEAQWPRSRLISEAMRGGFPWGRSGSPDERHDFFHALIRKICITDLPHVSTVRSSMTLRKVYRFFGASSGEIANLTQAGEVIGIRRHLAKRCLDALCLVDELPAWPASHSIARAVRSSKRFVSDSGWLSGLLGFCSVDPHAISRAHEHIVRRLLSTWVHSQLAALADANPGWKLWHFSHRTGGTIDFLLENDLTGALIAIGASPDTTASPQNFAPQQKFCALLDAEGIRRPVQAVHLYCGSRLLKLEGLGAAVPCAFLCQ